MCNWHRTGVFGAAELRCHHCRRCHYMHCVALLHAAECPHNHAWVALSRVLTSPPFHPAHRLLFGRAISRQELHPEPLIILGHPRTGTTHLHNLLSHDQRFAYLSTFQAGACQGCAACTLVQACGLTRSAGLPQCVKCQAPAGPILLQVNCTAAPLLACIAYTPHQAAPPM
jgi:hypothetical protein